MSWLLRSVFFSRKGQERQAGRNHGIRGIYGKGKMGWPQTPTVMPGQEGTEGAKERRGNLNLCFLVIGAGVGDEGVSEEAVLDGEAGEAEGVLGVLLEKKIGGVDQAVEEDEGTEAEAAQAEVGEDDAGQENHAPTCDRLGLEMVEREEEAAEKDGGEGGEILAEGGEQGAAKGVFFAQADDEAGEGAEGDHPRGKGVTVGTAEVVNPERKRDESPEGDAAQVFYGEIEAGEIPGAVKQEQGEEGAKAEDAHDGIAGEPRLL
jgi:hypothetical protein